MVGDNEQAAFIRAILAAPDDDSPKLIYADWLEERGESTEADSMRAGVRIARDNGIGMQLCWCPPGSFPGRKSARSKQRPPAATIERGFWLGKFPVTQRQYAAVTGVNPSYFAETGAGKDQVAGLDTSRFPVDGVSFLDASDFCTELTKGERMQGRLPPRWEFVLPPAPCWEYTCRAGTSWATPYGDRLDSQSANFHGGHPLNGANPGPYLGRTSKVGSYPSNPWGFHDQIGNVWEWCVVHASDRPSAQHIRIDPAALLREDDRRGIRRGGSWGNAGEQCQSHSTSGNFPDSRTNAQGFRVALVEHPPS